MHHNNFATKIFKIANECLYPVAKLWLDFFLNIISSPGYAKSVPNNIKI